MKSLYPSDFAAAVIRLSVLCLSPASAISLRLLLLTRLIMCSNVSSVILVPSLTSVSVIAFAKSLAACSDKPSVSSLAATLTAPSALSFPALARILEPISATVKGSDKISKATSANQLPVS